ncbi:MAG: hypothetical protein M1818_006785 [Claussenomyces sp. TS43310]|nr:MAG: hypothetical protein M1818_006785 [Claussenomyces sp. TS43310]
MGSEAKSKKRKAVLPDDEVEKVKKVKQMASEVLPKKRKSTDDSTSTVSKKSKAIKDPFSKDSDASPAKKSANKKKKALAEGVEQSLSENPKSSRDVAAIEKKVKALEAADTAVAKMPKPSKAKNQKSAEPQDDSTVGASHEEQNGGASDEEEIDDQTEALLKGFESNDDEDAKGEEYVAGQGIPDLDKKTKKKLAKAAKHAANQIADTPGVVYLGRIPHGFYENEMKQYFSQFGDISRIRLSRNRKTGQSKHFAFIEFKSAEVAEIVSKTMDNYLLFKHILKCKVVPKEQVHDELFKGANKRFKKVPWNRMEGRKLELGATEAQWERRNLREQEKRIKKAEKMKELGYEFDAPKLKSAKDVPKHKRQPLLALAEVEAEAEEPKAIEAPVEVVPAKDVTSKKQKKSRKSSSELQISQAVEPAVSGVAEVVEELAEAAGKVAAVLNEVAVDEEIAIEAPSKKVRKEKKEKSKKAKAGA